MKHATLARHMPRNEVPQFIRPINMPFIGKHIPLTTAPGHNSQEYDEIAISRRRWDKLPILRTLRQAEPRKDEDRRLLDLDIVRKYGHNWTTPDYQGNWACTRHKDSKLKWTVHKTVLLQSRMKPWLLSSQDRLDSNCNRLAHHCYP